MKFKLIHATTNYYTRLPEYTVLEVSTDYKALENKRKDLQKLYKCNGSTEALYIENVTE